MPLKNIRNVTQRQQNSQRNKLLRAAIRNNNIRGFKELGELSEKDITTKDNRGYTLLHEAALAESVDFLIEILPKNRTCTNMLMCRPKKKINVDVQDNEGNTPLMLAMDNNHHKSNESIINVLRSYGADYSYLENKYGQTAKDIYKIVPPETDWSYKFSDDGRNIKNFYPNSNNASPEEQPVPLDEIHRRMARTKLKELLVRPTVPSNFGPINPNGPKELPVPPPAAASYTPANIARHRRIKAILGEKVPPSPPSRPLQAPRGWAPPRNSKIDGGYRKKTARNNKGHTNVSRRWRRTSRVLRSSRVAARKTGRRTSRRTRRWNTAFVA